MKLTAQGVGYSHQLVAHQGMHQLKSFPTQRVECSKTDVSTSSNGIQHNTSHKMS